MFKFILIEGLDGVGKTTLVERLAEHLKAALLRSPPCIICEQLDTNDMREHFDQSSPAARRAYYQFANLIMSELATKKIAHQHVVMDRYWPSTVAYAALDDGPNINLTEQYPPHLKQPDLMILLMVDEENRKQRHQGRGTDTEEEGRLAQSTAGRENVLKRYRKFKPVEVDTSNLDEAQVLDAVLSRLRSKFADIT